MCTSLGQIVYDSLVSDFDHIGLIGFTHKYLVVVCPDILVVEVLFALSCFIEQCIGSFGKRFIDVNLVGTR